MGLSWDDVVQERATLDSISPEAIDYFQRNAIRNNRMSENSYTTDIRTVLKNLNLLDEDGQSLPTSSISAGLDYCGIGPQLAALGNAGRIEFTSALDKEALDAVLFFAKNEGVLFAMESAHAGAEAIKLAPTLPKDKAIIVNMSGRGDKDIFITCPVFRPEEWKKFLAAELERLNDNKDIHQAKSMN